MARRGRPPKLENAQDVMTVTEVAKFLRCGERTVRQLIYDRKLPALKAGGWRISRQALMDLMGCQVAETEQGGSKDEDTKGIA